MAIIVCSNCGKKITDRMEKCPHCHVVLIEQREQPAVTKKMIEASAKDGIVGVAIATVLTIALALTWFAVAIVYAEDIGAEATTALSIARTIFLTRNLVTLIVSTVFFGILPVLMHKKPEMRVLVGVILTAIFCAGGYFVQLVSIKAYHVDFYLFEYIKDVSIGPGFAFPMVLGSMAISSYNRPLKKVLIMQGVLAAAFIILAVILAVFMITNLYAGPVAFSLASQIAAVLVFCFVLFVNKLFR